MTAAEPRNWFARAARYHLDRSPINQHLRRARGKPTTWQRLLAEADLPPGPDGAIQRIALKTKVLPFERAAFVAELIGHCQDALDAGVAPNDVARSMGPPSRVGPLAAKAIRRKRPALLRPVFALLTGLRRTAVAFVSIYILAAIWFFARSPAINVDHLAELNAPNIGLAEADRAEPLIRQVSQGIEDIRRATARSMGYEDIVRVSPSEEDQWVRDWPEPDARRHNPAGFDAMLTEAAPLIARAREAAARPHLGAVWSQYDEELKPEPEDLIDDTLIGVLLPYLGRYREAARLLIADARRAADTGDTDTVAANLVAAAGLARQLTDDDPFFVSNLVAWAIHATVTRETFRILSHTPLLLDDAQLAAIDAALDLEFEAMGDGERRMYEDVVQRTYAPGEHGRITPDGWRLISELMTFDFLDLGLVQNPSPTIVVAPFVAPFIATRTETLERQRTVLDGYRAAAARTVAFPGNEDGIRQFELLRHRAPATDPLAQTILPATMSALNNLQRARTRRDAARLAIAVHRHLIRTGAFPNVAADIDTAVLTRVPPDRFTGEPMAYRLTDAGPLIYVTGPDRDDDAGRPVTPQPRGHNTDIADADDVLPVPEHRRPDGDWVLFPPEDDQQP